MKLYFSPTASAGSRWNATQDKAKAQHVPFDQVTVAEDGRQGMADLLNRSELEVFGVGVGMKAEIEEVREPTREEIINSNTPAMQTKARELMRLADGSTVRADDIEAFILDHASVAEVERIFSALGTRFAEQAKAVRS
jgi:hypothetical protein